MEVQVDVSESDVTRVELGDEVEVEVDAYIDKKFKGIVMEIANSATSAAGASLNSDQVTNFVVKIRVDPSSYQQLATTSNRFPLRPGMSASVEIFTSKTENVISVPIQAVTVRDEEIDEAEEEEKDPRTMEVVFATVSGADTIKMIEVKTGIQDDTYIEVVSGLEDGEEIVVGPYSAVSKKLKSGTVINKDKEDKKGKKGK